MNSPDETVATAGDARAGAGRSQSDGTAAAATAGDADTEVFPGDMGRLPVDTRRVLVQLLLGPSLDARRQRLLWPVLLRDESMVRSRLHELFLELVLDREQQVAFTRQVAADDLDVPVLLRRASLTFLESALLLYLRQRLIQADAAGERAVVSTFEMTEHLRVYERAGNADHARFDRLIGNAIEKGKKLSLLRKLRGSDERYEVAPTLKLLFSAEEIQALMRTYKAMSAPGDDDTAQAGAGGRPSASTSRSPVGEPQPALSEDTADDLADLDPAAESDDEQ